MQLTALTPTESLEKSHRLQSGNREEIDRFKVNFVKLFSLINEKDSEEIVKGHLMSFLNDVYYKDAYLIAPKDKTDFVIYSGKDATGPAGVLVEVKRPVNKGEMVTRQNLNAKAFHELLLYYFQERLDAHNNDIRYCVVTNVYEWFVFDAAVIDRVFFRNAHLTREYKAWASKQKVSTNRDLFYNEIAKPFLAALDEEIPFTYFDLRDFQKIVTDTDADNDKALLPLYKVLSPTHLLKLPTATDSNRLNPKFYSELLHLIGLEEIKDGGKKVIRRKGEGKRDEGSLLENTLIELDSSGKFYQLHDRTQYGPTADEQLFNVSLELCITWVNRILFLKLLESQLVKYHGGNKEYAFLNRETIPDFDELNKLFFRVLARKPAERQPASLQTKFSKVPYLNSSLFELTELENSTIPVSQLDNGLTLPVLRNSVLSDNPVYKSTKDLSTLSYLFAFLDAYDFASESRETIQEKNRTLINASVLGLIFEKINGYKDGSFYTPGFITEYMCRETIRKAVVQKFNDAKGWNCADFAALENKDLDRAEANALINEIRICDPAVGSGHFLVSALNELIAVKSDLGIWQDESGKRIKDYTVTILNDELIVQDEDETPFQYVLQTTGKPTPERQRVQKTLFQEKQTIIENCLFGVDINPNSVKICRLRLWIELLKNAYYTDESGFAELETLPNIDINIKQGNSLLSKFSLTEDLSDVFRKQKFSLRTYKNAVAAYKDAKSKDAKAELQRFINEIKSQFRETVSNRDPKRKKLADLRGQRVLLENNIDIFGNPMKDPKLVVAEIIRTDESIKQIETEIANIENNALYRGSFEWRFEFPEVLNDKGNFVGFDAIIGNPPYVSAIDLKKALGDVHYNKLKSLYSTAKGTVDLYVYFFELGIKILKSNQYLCYITPNRYLSANYAETLRKFLIDNTTINSIIDLSHVKVFAEAATYPIISFLTNRRTEHGYSVAVGKYEEGTDSINLTYADSAKLSLLEGHIWGFLLNEKITITEKIIKESVLLSTVGLINATSTASEAEDYHSLITSQAGYKLINTGTIDRYSCNWGITQLTDKGQKYLTPYLPYNSEVISKNRHKLYSSQKIVFAKIALRTEAFFDENGIYASINTNCIHSFKLDYNPKYVLAWLNSTLFQYVFECFFEGLKMQGGYLLYSAPNIEKMYIKKISLQEQIPYVELVSKILSAKDTDPTTDTLALEAEIDQLVYELYELTNEEIAIVEGN